LSLVALAALVLVVVVVALAASGRATDMTPGSYAKTGGIVTLVVAGYLAAIWRRVLTNAFNRRLAGLLMLAMTVSMAHRIFVFITWAPIPESATIDLLVYVVVMLAGAVTVLGRMWLGALPLAVGMALLRVLPPAIAAPVFGLSTMCSALVLSAVLWSVRRQP
jgi:hypothetical protein